MRVLLVFAVCVPLVVTASTVRADSAWWQFCESCTSDAQFAYRALNVPGSYPVVYVSNRSANVTRKYNRFETIEDFGDGYQRITHVSEASFPASEKQVFEDAISLANVVQVRLPRSDLGGLVPGIDGDASSVLFDIQNGYLSFAYVNSLVTWIELSGHLPTHESVNAEAGLSTPIAGANYGQGGTIRFRDLVLVIEYPDGSTIQVRRRPDGSLVNWGATDADGNTVIFSSPEGNLIPVDQNLFPGDYQFGPGGGDLGDAALELIREFNSFGGVLDCRMEERPGGGVRVVCTRR